MALSQIGLARTMAIVPLMDVDLFELSNNHCWRTDFAFGGWAERE